MFDPISFRIRNLAEAGDTVLTERIDEITANGVTAPVPVMGTFEVIDGRIVQWRDYFDTALVGSSWAAKTSPCCCLAELEDPFSVVCPRCRQPYPATVRAPPGHHLFNDAVPEAAVRIVLYPDRETWWSRLVTYVCGGRFQGSVHGSSGRFWLGPLDSPLVSSGPISTAPSTTSITSTSTSITSTSTSSGLPFWR